jgi:PPK2 family polyphosphate:nucleotide phosphotransferase
MRAMPDAIRTSDRWRVAPGGTLDLAAVDAGSVDGAPGGKKDTTKATDAVRDELAELQARLWAERERSVLAVLQAIDTGGKDGTIRHVLRGTNPAGVKVHAFGRPTDKELAHDFLWRIHQVTPGRGDVTVFNRSHYEDVLVVRVNGLAPEPVWRPRYKKINEFERKLAGSGTTVVKVMLHISRDEQRRRLTQRLLDPTKHWKFDPHDLDARAKWDDYQAAYGEALARCGPDEAPWYVLPADRKWYRDWALAHLLRETFADLKLAYPEPDFDVAAQRRRLDADG